MQNLHLGFVLCSASQKQGEDFAKPFGLLRICELVTAQVFYEGRKNLEKSLSYLMFTKAVTK